MLPSKHILYTKAILSKIITSTNHQVVLSKSSESFHCEEDGQLGTNHKSAHFSWIFVEEMLLQQKGAGGGAGGGIGAGAGAGGGGGSVEAERKALEAPVGLDDGSMHR